MKWHGVDKAPWGRFISWKCTALPNVEIRHCGHPTAVRPYYVRGIEALGRQAFARLKDAQDAVVRSTPWKFASSGTSTQGGADAERKP